MALSQTDVLITLAYLLGERTVNSSTTAPRADFVQETLNESYQAYPWRFATSNATLAISNSIATLPTNLDVAHQLYLSYYTGTSEVRLEQIDPADKYAASSGDNQAWITAQTDGTFLLNTKDPASSVIVRYQKKAPILDSAGLTQTPYPNKMTIALGARRYVKLGQNPDADISQDEDIFTKKLNKDIAAEQIPAPRKQRRSRQSQMGSHTGAF